MKNNTGMHSSLKLMCKFNMLTLESRKMYLGKLDHTNFLCGVIFANFKNHEND